MFDLHPEPFQILKRSNHANVYVLEAAPRNIKSLTVAQQRIVGHLSA
jgi:hypothetical protein